MSESVVASSAPGWPAACSRRCSAVAAWRSPCTSGVPTRGWPAPSAAVRSTSRSPRAAWPRWNGSACARLRWPRRCPCRGGWSTRLGAPPSFRPYSADGTRAINSISRAELNSALLDCAEATPGVTLRFGHRLASLDGDALRFDTPAGSVDVGADVVLACRRRVLPAVRRALQLDRARGLPRARLQRADHPAARRRVRAGPGRTAHLAARLVDDDRAAEPGPVVHLHPVLAEVGRSLRSTRPIASGRVSRALPRCRRAHAVPRR